MGVVLAIGILLVLGFITAGGEVVSLSKDKTDSSSSTSPNNVMGGSKELAVEQDSSVFSEDNAVFVTEEPNSEDDQQAYEEHVAA